MRPRVIVTGMTATILVLAVAGCGTADDATESSRGAIAVTATSPSAPAPTLAPGGLTPTAQAGDEPAVPTSVIADDAACDARITSSFSMFATVNDLVWSSHQVVTGTVSERHPPEKIEVAGSALPFTIVTDFSVAIDRQFRGQAAKQLRVRTLGGQIGNCAQEFPDSPTLEVGSAVVLFLREPDGASDAATPVAYEIVGGDQGYWTIDADGLASTRAVHLLPEQQPLPLAALEAAVVTELRAGPAPESSVLDEYLVPETEAPISVLSRMQPRDGALLTDEEARQQVRDFIGEPGAELDVQFIDAAVEFTPASVGFPPTPDARLFLLTRAAGYGETRGRFVVDADTGEVLKAAMPGQQQTKVAKPLSENEARALAEDFARRHFEGFEQLTVVDDPLVMPDRRYLVEISVAQPDTSTIAVVWRQRGGVFDGWLSTFVSVEVDATTGTVIEYTARRSGDGGAAPPVLSEEAAVSAAVEIARAEEPTIADEGIERTALSTMYGNDGSEVWAWAVAFANAETRAAERGSSVSIVRVDAITGELLELTTRMD